MNDTTNDTANAAISAVKTNYEQRILAFMEQIAEQAQAIQLETTKPEWARSDYYSWEFTAGWTDDEWFHFEIEIDEAREFGDDPPTGINFHLRITKADGEIVATWAPANYTPDVWVDARDAAAVLERWELFESVDLSEVWYDLGAER